MLTLPLSRLKAVTPGTYTISVALTNIFGANASASITFDVSLASAGAPPLFSLLSGLAALIPSQAFSIIASL